MPEGTTLSAEIDLRPPKRRSRVLVVSRAVTAKDTTLPHKLQPYISCRKTLNQFAGFVGTECGIWVGPGLESC